LSIPTGSRGGRSAGARFRELLAEHSPLVLPGVFDALSARTAAASGFEAVYMSGFGTSASRMALPDNGLLTMSEMVDQAASIVEATALPVLADADAGYGGPASMERTVRRYEQAGVAAIHLEDTVSPKRGLYVVSRTEMVERIEASLGARTDPSFFVVGRTDAYDTLGFDEAIERARLLASAGVDAVFVHSLTQYSEFDRLRKAVDVPLLMNIVEGVTQPESSEEAARLGYELVVFSISCLRRVVSVEIETYSRLREEGRLTSLRETFAPLDEVAALLNGEPLADQQESRAPDHTAGRTRQGRG
jgi:2-methylisocitrate lyase-like PEP mutase family enzyme